ncbi:sulfotransferase family 2 domain-containing protein [Vibrio plantisponsor]|uniref:sulfotransferase family 2 domain-containing protein n=1 Tax=Vibrio plantisponsor TaxID=664643 RepID=UPI00370C5897
MIFHSYKSIFIHIPKTGGSSVENLLWPDLSTRTESDLWMGLVRPYFNKYQTGGLQHLLAHQIKKEVGEDIFRQYYKFTLVRNPWDKVISQYMFMINKRDDLRTYINMPKNASLAEYIELIQKKEHVQWAKQVDFILDENGELLVDDVFKLENINDDASIMSSRIGLNFSEIPHDNKGSRKPYQDYYTEETKEMVYDIYKDDILYLNYNF